MVFVNNFGSVEATSVSELKEKLNLPGTALVFHLGKLLANAAALSSECLDICLASEGGKKKKKRKIPSGPKKVKKPRSKVSTKLMVLNYFKVDGDNVERLRTPCEKCGAGVYMAKHAAGSAGKGGKQVARLSCGRCGYTVMQ